MRISDWSSDVCSSDLLVGDARLIHSAYGNATVHERPLLTLWYMPHWNTMSPGMQARAMMGYMRNDDIVTPERPLTPLDWTPELRTRGDDEIGRASGRDRVCQYG